MSCNPTIVWGWMEQRKGRIEWPRSVASAECPLSARIQAVAPHGRECGQAVFLFVALAAEIQRIRIPVPSAGSCETIQGLLRLCSQT